MSAEETEDEALVLSAAVFAGSGARALLDGLVEERAVRCRARLVRLSQGPARGRRERLATALRRLFGSPTVDVSRASPADIAVRLRGETPAIRSLVLGGVPAPLAAQVAALLAQQPTPSAAPAPPLRRWLWRFLMGDLQE